MVRFEKDKIVIELKSNDPKGDLAELQKSLIDILSSQKEDTYVCKYISSMCLLEFLYQTTQIDE